MIVRVQQQVEASIKDVWNALTDPDQMKQWYFEDMPDFKPEIGFTTSFVMHSEERTFAATWRVTSVIPEKKISYTWSYDEYEGVGSVQFDLEALPEGSTLVTVTNDGLESFPQDVPEFTHESCKGGWEYFIQGRLPEFLSE